jgi:hypothetical protein
MACTAIVDYGAPFFLYPAQRHHSLSICQPRWCSFGVKRLKFRFSTLLSTGKIWHAK